MAFSAQLVAICIITLFSTWLTSVCYSLPVLLTDLQDKQVAIGGTVEFLCTIMDMDLFQERYVTIQWRLSHTLSNLDIDATGSRQVPIPSGFSPHEHGTYRISYTPNYIDYTLSYYLIVTGVTLNDGDLRLSCGYQDTIAYHQLSKEVRMKVVTSSPVPSPTEITDSSALVSRKTISPGSMISPLKTVSGNTQQTTVLVSGGNGQNSTRRKNTSAVIGGVSAGCFALLTVLVLLILFYRTNRYKKCGLCLHGGSILKESHSIKDAKQKGDPAKDDENSSVYDVQSFPNESEYIPYPVSTVPEPNPPSTYTNKAYQGMAVPDPNADGDEHQVNAAAESNQPSTYTNKAYQGMVVPDPNAHGYEHDGESDTGLVTPGPFAEGDGP